MKHKHFYSHLIETSDVTVELAELELAPDERIHLTSLMEANIHSVVIDTVLTSLPDEEKRTFLKNLVSNDHDEIWNHLKSKNKEMEEKIIRSVDNLKRELFKDIKESQKSKD